MSMNWTLDAGATPATGPFRRTANDGLKWMVVYQPRLGWVLSAGTEPAGKFSEPVHAFRVAAEADECRI